MTVLHGFLGRPSDWREVFDGSGLAQLNAPNWFPIMRELPGSEMTPGLPDLADQLNVASVDSHGDVLLGYSMGGRIALHMLLQDRPPFRWRKAIIVSASPGIASQTERRRRWDQDRRWAERFRLQEWSSLMAEWQAQSVFDGEPGLERFEADFERGELATALSRGSIGTQQDLRNGLAKLEIPVLWIAGERDLKYCSIAQEAANLNPRFQVQILPNSGHRCPWSNTPAFMAAVSEFLGK